MTRAIRSYGGHASRVLHPEGTKVPFSASLCFALLRSTYRSRSRATHAGTLPALRGALFDRGRGYLPQAPASNVILRAESVLRQLPVRQGARPPFSVACMPPELRSDSRVFMPGSPRSSRREAPNRLLRLLLRVDALARVYTHPHLCAHRNLCASLSIRIRILLYTHRYVHASLRTRILVYARRHVCASLRMRIIMHAHRHVNASLCMRILMRTHHHAC
jgi:hypothetical protein